MADGFRLAVSTWTFKQRSLFEALDILHLLGATDVELWADGAHLDPRLALPEIEEVAAALDRLGLAAHSLHAPFRGLDLAAPAAEERLAAVNTIARALEVAARLDCRYAVVHPSNGFNWAEGPEREAAWQRTVASLEQLCRRAGQLGVTVLIENLPDPSGDVIGGRSADLLALIQAVGSPNLGICLDVGHALVSTGGWEQELAAVYPHLLSIHAADGDGSADAHLPLGEGSVPWERLLSALAGRGYTGGFVLEVAGGEDGVRRSLDVAGRLRSG
ncbi:MAG: hypothetical protein BAA04_09440 [Firmicutes bacterium ZCTH02-B6]|nr:MAG: hypothetical protein BAA04_09440 [Firmicutes bacterium ZCTH02-B6]